MTLTQLLGLLGSLFFLGQALTAMLVYVWSRRSPQVRVNLFGLLTLQAPFLPWALMGFSLLLGNSILVDLLGEPVCPSSLPQSKLPEVLGKSYPRLAASLVLPSTKPLSCVPVSSSYLPSMFAVPWTNQPLDFTYLHLPC